MQVGLRLRAAAWTAAIALIPALVAAQQWLEPNGLGAFVDMQESVSLAGMTLMAIAAAGVSGFLLVEPLLDPEKQHDGVAAVARGVVAALLAYFLLCSLVVAVMVAPMYLEGRLKPFEAIGNFLAYPFYGLWFGLLSTGWYTLPVAGVAGYLLSARYRG